ncbi:hypothetical protein phiAS5_ORF0213 [Aeromonas phage phiAS5]|uniref:Uncharacterized protein n=1 Tax=Aeromonas phage phiAS5 TaxID=879630 RepID=E1A2W0_9CAUD|nr:hypothetical protein phiAS5_ORF0213 [Aeromonas phage phiAS5]ADM80056.1 hypothetical protein phiAS5_ORF0213 [Aeromonas phage phiAS5]
MCDEKKERKCRCEGNWLEEQIENYLAENLSINLNRRHGYYNDVTLEIEIKLGDKVIANATEYL